MGASTPRSTGVESWICQAWPGAGRQRSPGADGRGPGGFTGGTLTGGSGRLVVEVDVPGLVVRVVVVVVPGPAASGPGHVVGHVVGGAAGSPSPVCGAPPSPSRPHQRPPVSRR